MKALSRLRIFFIIYFIVKLVIDITLVSLNKETLNDMSIYAFTDATISYSTMMIIILLINTMLLVIGLWLFYYLLKRRNWARIVLLIIGWLAVIDFFSSLILSQKSVKMLEGISGKVNWDQIIMMDIVSDLISLIFWGYLIYVLMFKSDIKQLFHQESERNISAQNL